MKKLIALFSILLLLTACGEKSIIEQPGFNKKDHHFVTKAQSEIMDDVEASVPGTYYFGYGECPVCQELVPVLEEVLTELDQTATYIDVSKEEFQKISERFQTFDASLPENRQSGGGVPFVVGIDEDGTIRTHAGTVGNFQPGQTEMNEDQIEYLSIKLKQVITGE